MSVAVLIATIWIAWAAFNLCIALLSQHWGSYARTAHVVGLWRYRIVIPEEVAEKVSLSEYVALGLHEYGHVHHRHIRKNLVLAVLLPFCRTRARAQHQELEADAYAAGMGYGPALASALRKLSRHPFDLERAQLLDRP